MKLFKCSCAGPWQMSDQEARKYLNGVCNYCEKPFYEIDKVDKMELRMELKPELKTVGLQEQKKRESLINQGYFNLMRTKKEQKKKEYYSYDDRMKKVVKLKKNIIIKDTHKTPDVFEFLTRNNKKE